MHKHVFLLVLLVIAGCAPSRQELRPPEPATQSSIIELDTAFAEGVDVLDSILAIESAETLEGRFGALLAGRGMECLTIDFMPGMYTAEHPHANESMVYTISGRWVLASNGRRCVMEPGSLMWFDAGAPTGYENPFDEPALTINFIVQEPKPRPIMVEYLSDVLKNRWEKRHQQGQPFLLSELEPEHPARVYARKVNPGGGW